MENEDFDRTVPIDNLAELVKEEEDGFEYPSVESREENNNEMYAQLEEEKLTKMDKVKKWWRRLRKPVKVVIILILLLILIALVGVIVFFATRDKEEEKPKNSEPKEEVIVVKDNYIYKDGVLSLLNESDEEVGTYKCVNKDENLCYVAYTSVEDEFDTVSLVYQDDEEVLLRSKIYNDNYAFIYDSEDDEGLIVLYDIKNEEVVGTYQLVKGFTYDDVDYVILKDEEDMYGLYSFGEEFETVIEASYDYMGYIEGRKHLVVANGDVYSLVDFKGKEVVSGIKEEIRDYSDKHIVTYALKSYKLIDFSKAELVNNNDDFIGLNDGYYVAVKNDELRVNLLDGEKLHEEGFELITKQYVMKSIYNEDGLKIRDLVSFKTEKDEDSIVISVFGEEGQEASYSIDVRDASVSKNLKYYSYYGGKLYFYEDEGKTMLIGSYSCKNKNDLTEGKLNNCNVAYDTVYEDNYIYRGSRVAMVPIINNRFVFINDSKDGSTENKKEINLYNLATDKVMATYRSVNTRSANNDGVLSHVTNANYEVMAQNTSGKYGMFSIGLTNATGIYEFNYDYIEKLDDGVSVRSGDSWQVLDGSDSSAKYPGRIMRVVDDRAIVLINEKVSLYDEDGSEIVDREFDYIGLGEDYFGGIIDGKVYPYDYDGNAVSGEGYEVSSTDYLNSKLPVFKFSSNNGLDYIDVLNEDNSSYSTYELGGI